jgi:hypothetical protein
VATAAEAAVAEARTPVPARVSAAIQRTVFLCTIDLFQANPPRVPQ